MNKKLFNLSLLFAAILAFTSCSKNNDPKSQTETVKENLMFASAVYYENSITELQGKYGYFLVLATDGKIDKHGKFTGQGNVYKFFIVRNSAADSMRPMIPTGTYKLSDNTLMGDDNSVQQFNTSGLVGEPTKFSEAELVITPNKTTLKAKIKSDKDIIYDVTFNGALPKCINFRDEPYAGFEKNEVRNVNIPVDAVKIINSGDALRNGTTTTTARFTVASDAKNQFASLVMVLRANYTGAMPDGTYTVDGTGKANTILMSQGIDENGDTWSVACSGASNYFFIVGGQATVTGNDFNLAGKSYFGSTVNVTFNGEMTVGNPQNSIMRRTISRL